MALDLNAVAAALANTITNAAVLVNGVQVVATDYPAESITAPQFCVEGFETDYHQTFKGFAGPVDKVTFKCRVYLARTTDVDAARFARQLVSFTGSSTSSVVTALEAAKGPPGVAALGGAASDLTVLSSSGSHLVEVGAVQFVSADISVAVFG